MNRADLLAAYEAAAVHLSLASEAYDACISMENRIAREDAREERTAASRALDAFDIANNTNEVL